MENEQEIIDTSGSTDSDIDTSNIFDDFQDDEDLQQEVKEINDGAKKTSFYYFSLIGRVCQTLFWITFIIGFAVFSYVYVQKDVTMKNVSVIDPICKVFLGDTPKNTGYCSSVSAVESDYQAELDALKSEQSEEILEILDSLYATENFTRTKAVLFLVNKKENKLAVLDMLQKFDDIKRKFATVDKQKIQCSDVEIYDQNILTLKCEAYSAGYEKGIRGFDGSNIETLGGTSISIANSFLNFLSKESKDFTILDRQKIFGSESIPGESTGFTHKTSFDIKLKYNSENLSL